MKYISNLKTIFLVSIILTTSNSCKNYLTKESPLILPPQYRDIPQDNLPNPLNLIREDTKNQKEEEENYNNIKLSDD